MIQRLDVRKNETLYTDVLIVGGGAAGVAAAHTLACQNKKVIIVEKYGFCGGGAVAGLSGTICGMYEASEKLKNKPKQSVFGFTDRFAKMMTGKRGTFRASQIWKNFYKSS